MVGIIAASLGLTAARALRGRTYAGARVYHEPNVPVKYEDGPCICIFCAHGAAPVEGSALLEATSKIRLLFMLFIPSTVTDSSASSPITLDVNSSMAWPFAFFWRQVETALQSDNTTWANLFRALRISFSATQSIADLFETDKGQKIPYRALEVMVDAINEPVIGEAPTGVWADLIAAMRADGPELTAVGNILAAHIQGDATLSDWRQDFTLLGLSPEDGVTLGLDWPGNIVETDPALPYFEVSSDPANPDAQI
jgi:hypothetical protein